jgi:hypothetical protein
MWIYILVYICLEKFDTDPFWCDYIVKSKSSYQRIIEVQDWKMSIWVEIKTSLAHSPSFIFVSESVNPPPPQITFWTPQSVFIKLGVCIMAPKPISTADFINPSHQSVCLCVYPYLLLLSSDLVNTFPWKERQATVEEWLEALFCVYVLCHIKVCLGVWISPYHC